MGTLAIWIGTVGLALVLIVVVAVLLRVAWTVLRDGPDEIAQPIDMVERLGALTHGQAFTDTCQRRAAVKRRLYVVAQKSRGPARLSPVVPKDAA